MLDLSAPWNWITDYLAPVSLVSVGGAIGWVHRRFSKKLRFKMLSDNASDAFRAISFYQQSRSKAQEETLDTLVEMLHDLQSSLRPLGVHLFSEAELTTAWLNARDKPLREGGPLAALGQERIREVGLTVRLVGRHMRAGDYRKAKGEFPPNYHVARRRFSSRIKHQRDAVTKSFMETHGIEDKRPELPGAQPTPKKRNRQ